MLWGMHRDQGAIQARWASEVIGLNQARWPGFPFLDPFKDHTILAGSPEPEPSEGT